MLKFKRAWISFVAGLFLAGCNSQPQPQPGGQNAPPSGQEHIFEGGDDSPITIADGSLDIFTKLSYQTVTANSDYTIKLPNNFKFHHIMDENSLQTYDLRGHSWVIHIGSHNVDLKSTDQKSVEITASNGDTLMPVTTIGGYRYPTILHHSNGGHIQNVTLQIDSGTPGPVSCTMASGKCHILIVGCHANGCS